MCSSGPVLTKPQSTILHFAKKKVDIICLTEIKISKSNRNFYFHKDYNTYLNLPPDPFNNAPREGVATLIKKELCENNFDVSFPVEGRATHIKFEINDEKLDCHCLYAPSQSDTVSSKFFTELLDSLPDCDNSIFLGDFNTVLDPALDRKDTDRPYHKPKTSRIINDHALNNALVDPWRTANPLKRE